MSYSVAQTATIMVDNESLAYMLQECMSPDTRAALIGFNEYSKHLLNLAGHNIAGIYDEDDWKVGINFRNKMVMPQDTVLPINKLIVCEYSQLYGFVGIIRRLYNNEVQLKYPPRLHYKKTVEINVFEQEAAYTSIDLTSPHSPRSMMDEKKLQFLAELLRSGLCNKGDIVEMGVYQAGSVWYLANILSRLGEDRTFHMIDVFEQHVMHPNATMCKDEIMRKLSFYPNCRLHEGLVDDPEILSTISDQQFCFVHYDLGVHAKALDFVWERLQPGSPLVLDNYGHIAIQPWDLDDFFSQRGAHVVRNPWSEQGFVFKPHRQTTM